MEYYGAIQFGACVLIDKNRAKIEWQRLNNDNDINKNFDGNVLKMDWSKY